MSDSICKFFLEGNCRRGKKCRFSHGDGGSKSVPATPAVSQVKRKYESQTMSHEVKRQKPSPKPVVQAKPQKVSFSSSSSSESDSDSESEPEAPQVQITSKNSESSTKQKDTPTTKMQVDSDSSSSDNDSDSSSSEEDEPPVVAKIAEKTPQKKEMASASAPSTSKKASESKSSATATPTPKQNGDGKNEKTTKEQSPAHEINEKPPSDSMQKKQQEKQQNRKSKPAPRTLLAGYEALHMLVARTKNHPKYSQFFKLIEKPRLPKGWKQTEGCRSMFGGSQGGYSHIGLDCEMVQTTHSDKALCRVTLVTLGACVPGKYPGKPLVLLDLYVKPEHKITDYRTSVSGITEELLKDAVSFQEAQEAFLSVVSGDTVLVGHSVHYDLESLKIAHRLVIDTSLVFQIEKTDRSLSLKDLVQSKFECEMQPLGQSHDSVVDALWPLELVRDIVDKIEEQGQLPCIPDKPLFHMDDYFQVAKPASYKQRLGVYNIPKDIDLEQLQSLLPQCPDDTHWKHLGTNDTRTQITFADEDNARAYFMALPCIGVERANDGMLKKKVPLGKGKPQVEVKAFAKMDSTLEDMF